MIRPCAYKQHHYICAENIVSLIENIGQQYNPIPLIDSNPACHRHAIRGSGDAAGSIPRWNASGMNLMCRYISAVIRDNEGNFLLRKEEGVWRFLGGEVIQGESPKEAYIRMTSEEFGVITNDIELMDVLSNGENRQIHVFSGNLDKDKSLDMVADEGLGLFNKKQMETIKLDNYTHFVLDKLKL